MKPKVVEQVEKVLNGITTVEGITEIERIIKEAKERILFEPSKGFWNGKTPCWEMCHCPEMVRSECPAPKYPFLPCWQIEGTYCKLDDRSANGLDTSICEPCQVYKKYGDNSLLKIKLFGKGMDTTVKVK